MATPDKTQKVKPPIKLLKCHGAMGRLSPDDYGDIATVIVGKGGNERTFLVHEGLLTHYSSYFKAALKKEWEEGATRTVKLPEDEPEVFRAFFHFLLSTGHLYFSADPESPIPLDFDRICEIFVFGDARGAPDLCNAAINLLFQKSCQLNVYPINSLHYVYDNTGEMSLLRKFLVDFATEQYTWTSFRIYQDAYPRDFLVDVMEQLIERKAAPGWIFNDESVWTLHKKRELCSKYHEHPK